MILQDDPTLTTIVKRFGYCCSFFEFMAGEGMLAARPILVRIVLAMFAVALGAELARADTKVALVIGNSKYVSADALNNPANDAAIVKGALNVQSASTSSSSRT